MAPESSHEEIKRAFTARALKYHPDRQPDESAREHAAWRTKEISEAWATLRNPAARAAYDAALKAGEAGPAAGLVGTTVGAARQAGSAEGYQPFPSRSAHPVGADWFTEPEVADIDPIDETEDAKPAGWFKAWHLGPLIVGAVVLAIVLVLLMRTNNYDDRPNVVQTRERFGAGTCVTVVPVDGGDPQVTEVPCSGPHTGRVQSRVEFPKPCPLQTRNIVLAKDQLSLCLQP